MLVAGDGVPDPAGNYSPVGWFGGQRYYTSPTTDFYIYFGVGASIWIISLTLEDPPHPNAWWRNTLEGTYAPTGTYLGNPTVTEE